MVPETLGDQVVENWINHAVDGEQALASQKEPLVQNLFFDQGVVDEQPSVGKVRKGKYNEDQEQDNDNLEEER